MNLHSFPSSPNHVAFSSPRTCFSLLLSHTSSNTHRLNHWRKCILSSALRSHVRGTTSSVPTTHINKQLINPLQDINNSGDGGIHGQLLQNNGFQGISPTLAPYAAVGNTTLTLDTAVPLTSAITKTLKVTVPSGTTGSVGFSNSGYSGVPVNADTYQSYFWIKGGYNGTITISLVGSSSGIVYGSSDIIVTSTIAKFTYVTTKFASLQSPDGDNVWQLTFDGSQVAGGSLWFGLVQLFPVTYHERFNGIRADVGNFLEAMGPSFLRFPGGNNL